MFRRFLSGAGQRVPALNIKPSGSRNRGNLSSLPPTSQSGAVVAVQPVVVQQTQPQPQNVIQQVFDQPFKTKPVNISWTPIVQTIG